MDESVSMHEATIHLTAFPGMFLCMAAREVLTPRRTLSQPKAVRRLNDIALVVLKTLLRLLSPTAALCAAPVCSARQWGLFNQVEAPAWLFGNCRAQPEDGHGNLVIGIDAWRDPARCVRQPGLLLQPFGGKATDYAINRRRWKQAP